VGVYGMGALAAVCAALLAGLWSRPVKAVLFLGGVLVLWSLAPVLQLALPDATEPHGELPMVLLQGNIAQDEKFEPGSGVPQALDWYTRRMTADPSMPPGALVVAPETAFPLLPQQLGLEFWLPLLDKLSTQNHAVLVGLPLGDYLHGYANAVWGITPRQAWLALARLDQGASPARLDEPDVDSQGTPIYRYDKHHLVPFGEFIPPLFRWFVDLMNIPLGDFNRGRLGQPTFEWNGQRIAPHICYEDLFGEELARSFVHAGSAPTVLVNISNLAWFGNTVALDQHLQIARLRAMELGRPMVRATNTGATVVINHRGVVTQVQPRQSAGVLRARVEGRSGLTPFARWAAHWGLWPVWWLALAVLAAAGLVRARRRVTA
jgi:apolipoprotein N-acyltransferase